MAAIGRLAQTITIVDKSNKVVGTSKQLKDVYHEAKNAYLERKAEIKAERKKREDKELQKALYAASVADEEERGSDVSRSRTERHTRTHESSRRRRTSVDSSRFSDAPRETRNSRPSRLREADGSRSPRSVGGHRGSTQSRSAPVSPVEKLDLQPNQMVRRSKTDIDIPSRPKLARSRSTPDVDMDLAYGEFHAGDLRTLSQNPHEMALSKNVPLDPKAQQQELSSLVAKCQLLLDEANCAQHSARKIVSHLQSNPEAMAAIGLTLAEISNIATKMAPGALAMFSKSAPAVIALLASPQFLIAVGVGIGVTVIMFGGYKIVKKIKAAKAANESSDDLAFGANGHKFGGMDEALDVRELDRIEHWRRGIADSHAESFIDDDRHTVCSAATSVEGEFITPYAARSMGHLPLKPKDSKKSKKDKDKETDKDKAKREKKEKKLSSSKKSSSKREGDEGDDEESSSTTNTAKSQKQGRTIKIKKPSPLRRMFASGTSEKA